MKNILRNLFAVFLRNRRIVRHFRRLALFETLPRTGLAREVPASFSEAFFAAAHEDADELLAKLGSCRRGLSEKQAETVRQSVGVNEVAYEKPLPWWEHLWLSYRNPFNLLLTLLGAISALTDDHGGALIIGSMIVFSTLLRFRQEVKANKAADALKAMVGNTATVLRPLSEEARAETPRAGNGQGNCTGALQSELPIRMLVPGDVIALSAGDMIPADCRLLSAKDLFVSQAVMTGESMPVEKFPFQRQRQNPGLLDLDTILFMETNVVSGSALALVVRTGNNTYFGSLAATIAATDHAPTSFQAGVNQVSWLLIRFMAVMAPLVLLINGFTKGSWMEAALFALSVAVGLTPTMLPMVATATLAKGAVFLSRKKVIVKRLDAIQNFGAMDVLCTDKTGTLTQDQIVLSRHCDPWGERSGRVLELAYCNSYYQTGLKNLLDVAVLRHHAEPDSKDPDPALWARACRKVDEIPFDFNRRRMSVVVEEPDGSHFLIAKGAVEEILSVCARVARGAEEMPLAPDVLDNLRAVTESLNRDGLRVVAVALKDLTDTQAAYSVADERDLTLAGYIAFLDPPKDSARGALCALAGHGVNVKVLTGDNALVSARVCREVGLEVTEGSLLLGPDIDAMDDAALSDLAEEAIVFARLTPGHKARIVRLLKEKGHVVGFLGDGINDAAALHAADIGISVDSGADIAKEASDIVLLEKNLLVLEQGVREGRRTFANMLKYIKMTASSNFGNVLSVLVAGAFLPFLPMLPIHLLVQNLLYDISQTAVPFDSVDEEQLKKPQRWRPGDIGRFMVYFGPLSSLFDIITFLLMWYVFAANSVSAQTLFQSGWFVVGLVTQTMVVHMIRSPKIPFVQSRASAPLTAMTAVIIGTGIFLPMGPLAPYLKLEAPPPLYFAFLPLIVFAYMALSQVLKLWYIRRFGWQ